MGVIASPEHPSSASQDEDCDDMGLLRAPEEPTQCAAAPSAAFTSHKWLYHLDACAGSVLTPHDYITNVHKGLGNRIWVSDGQCRCCGSFLDPQLEHAETCSNAEATREHHVCVHAAVCGKKQADPGISSLLRNAGRLIFSPSQLSPDAVRPWTCVWPLPLQQKLAEVLHRRHSIVNFSITGMKSAN